MDIIKASVSIVRNSAQYLSETLDMNNSTTYNKVTNPWSQIFCQQVVDLITSETLHDVLQLLSLGGNAITDVPETVGNLPLLQGLILCDNSIEHLPASIAKLKNLKSLLLHKNRLKHLPRDIITLKNLVELSLRDNPLVVRFVQDISLSPATLLELAARTIRSSSISYGTADVPRTLMEYLESANCCVNPKCAGVFFDNRIEHIKFVDFCGKYRVPLLQYLCSSKCIEPVKESEEPQPGASGFMMRKVLLG